LLSIFFIFKKLSSTLIWHGTQYFKSSRVEAVFPVVTRVEAVFLILCRLEAVVLVGTRVVAVFIVVSRVEAVSLVVNSCRGCISSRIACGGGVWRLYL
jgi:hypothetical protein